MTLYFVSVDDKCKDSNSLDLVARLEDKVLVAAHVHDAAAVVHLGARWPVSP